MEIETPRRAAVLETNENFYRHIGCEVELLAKPKAKVVCLEKCKSSVKRKTPANNKKRTVRMLKHEVKRRRAQRVAERKAKIRESYSRIYRNGKRNENIILDQSMSPCVPFKRNRYQPIRKKQTASDKKLTSVCSATIPVSPKSPRVFIRNRYAPTRIRKFALLQKTSKKSNDCPPDFKKREMTSDKKLKGGSRLQKLKTRFGYSNLKTLLFPFVRKGQLKIGGNAAPHTKSPRKKSTPSQAKLVRYSRVRFSTLRLY